MKKNTQQAEKCKTRLSQDIILCVLLFIGFCSLRATSAFLAHKKFGGPDGFINGLLHHTLRLYSQPNDSKILHAVRTADSPIMGAKL